ncbi:hypothetical protein QMK61_06725 [Fulvimonas sp. R45]|jgi:hypothetical protein|uniref:hypothetical protein n=1 Tax=Fulvimonas sp. R45 TaxID=3045937 RepID=UPI00265EC63A|nr:hypothetical protein [Fulvimonas sp. R45]MDO1528528.1 hypothetical protein [Fulvimonas sp. R45]
MPTSLELSAETLDRLVEQAIGSVDLGSDRLIDPPGAMATANTCYRSCGHTLCLCVA